MASGSIEAQSTLIPLILACLHTSLPVRGDVEVNPHAHGSVTWNEAGEGVAARLGCRERQRFRLLRMSGLGHVRRVRADGALKDRLRVRECGRECRVGAVDTNAVLFTFSQLGTVMGPCAAAAGAAGVTRVMRTIRACCCQCPPFCTIGSGAIRARGAASSRPGSAGSRHRTQ